MSAKADKSSTGSTKVLTLDQVIGSDCIQTGYLPRSKEAKDIKGDAATNTGELSFTNIRPDSTIEYPKNATIVMGDYCEDFIVRPGDVLFRGRVAPPVATYVNKEDLNGALRDGENIQQFIYSSAIIRIRLSDTSNILCPILPEYLAAYINSPVAQRHFTKHTQGSMISGVGKRDLLTLPVYLPPLEDQERIAELVRVHSEYKKTTQALVDSYNSIIKFYFLSLPKN